MGTKIKWATESWNPITGCTKISPGCKNCYAERMSKRLAGRSGYPKSESECPICGEVYDRAEPFCMEHPNAKLIRRSPFDVTLHEDKLDLPLKWRKPRRIFVCSMGDLFHKNVPDDLIVKVFTVAQLTSRHTYMILTKRPERMAEYLQSDAFWHEVFYASIINARRRGIEWEEKEVTQLKNVWLGVTAENQEWWDKRKDALFAPSAAVHWVSYEPAIGPLVFSDDDLARLDWVVCGGETSYGARPMNPDWARSVRDQCQAAGVKFFFKGWGAWRMCALETLDLPELHTTNTVRHSMGWPPMERLGKKRAGRILDGREWNEYPEEMHE